MDDIPASLSVVCFHLFHSLGESGQYPTVIGLEPMVIKWLAEKNFTENLPSQFRGEADHTRSAVADWSGWCFH
ncbi:MAG: hypothetical protein IKX30_08640 [Victivallales bacterium]|nr:hypothetical protein [Victivallales bacterium]